MPVQGLARLTLPGAALLQKHLTVDGATSLLP